MSSRTFSPEHKVDSARHRCAPKWARPKRPILRTRWEDKCRLDTTLRRPGMRARHFLIRGARLFRRNARPNRFRRPSFARYFRIYTYELWIAPLMGRLGRAFKMRRPVGGSLRHEAPPADAAPRPAGTPTEAS